MYIRVYGNVCGCMVTWTSLTEGLRECTQPRATEISIRPVLFTIGGDLCLSGPDEGRIEAQQREREKERKIGRVVTHTYSRHMYIFMYICWFLYYIHMGTVAHIYEVYDVRIYIKAALPANSRRPCYIYEAHKVASTAAYIAT